MRHPATVQHTSFSPPAGRRCRQADEGQIWPKNDRRRLAPFAATAATRYILSCSSIHRSSLPA
ncbi:MAG: hypothetical protein DI528_14760 [Shinella sp.]|nr:MAG: hypothetical protein DI528_14760 [Shinella sp.]